MPQIEFTQDLQLPLRFGEAANTRTEDIDLVGHRVLVNNRLPTPDIPPFTIKNDGQTVASKERTVPIPGACMGDLSDAMRYALKSGGFLALTPRRFDIVREHWKLCQQNKPYARHPWRPWQNRDLLNNTLRDAKVLLERAGIVLTAPFTLHTFRKSFAQNLADAATPVKTLAKLLGHSNSSVTLEHYAKMSDGNELAARYAMDRLFGENRTADAG